MCIYTQLILYPTKFSEGQTAACIALYADWLSLQSHTLSHHLLSKHTRPHTHSPSVLLMRSMETGVILLVAEVQSPRDHPPRSPERVSLNVQYLQVNLTESLLPSAAFSENYRLTDKSHPTLLSRPVLAPSVRNINPSDKMPFKRSSPHIEMRK